MNTSEDLIRNIQLEYRDIIVDVVIHHSKIRFFLNDGSFVDIWWSKQMKERFSFHWERRGIDATFYRHDNFPDPRWSHVATFPYHFHNGCAENVEASTLPHDPIDSVRTFFKFIKENLLESIRNGKGGTFP